LEFAKPSSRMRDIICQSTLSSLALAASERAARLRQRARASLVFIVCGSCSGWPTRSLDWTLRTYTPARSSVNRSRLSRLRGVENLQRLAAPRLGSALDRVEQEPERWRTQAAELEHRV